MATATARTTIGSVFGTIGVAANAVSSTITTGVAAIGMLDTLVTDAAKRQKMRSKADMDDFAAQLAEEKGIEIATRQVDIQDFRAKSPVHAKLFDENYQRVLKLLAEDTGTTN